MLTAILVIISAPGCRPPAVDQAAKPGSQFQGKPLTHWVAQASAPEGPADLERTVAALTEAVQAKDPNVKRGAADALSALGPRAKAALPALLNEFNHEFPWVRVSCQAAVASMGPEALPALIETFETRPGSPRILAAFVMGGLGGQAKPAVPVIQKVMQQETPANRERLLGVLGQIDPEQFGRKVAPAAKARYEPVPAGPPSLANVPGGWPQYHGPGRDSVSRETGLLREWPQNGPKPLWTLEGLGRGYSTVSIADGKLYTMGDRAVAGGGEGQFVLAYDLSTRKELWAAPAGPAHPDGGPRSTPALDGDALYALGTAGDLVCLDRASGSVRWKKNLAADFGGKMMSTWKYSESVLVDGDRVVCTPGGPSAVMAALNKRTGEVIWTCALPDIGPQGADGAAYASAVAADICGVRQYVQMVGRGVIGVEASTGKFLWGYNRIANTVANVTSPLVRGDYVFATTAYNTGAVLLKISRAADAFQAGEVYFIDPADFQNHHGGVVLVGEHLYGGHGSNRGDPACIEFGTGKVLWKERAPAKGSAGLLYADGHLVFRYDRGDVLLIEASPVAMKVKGRFQTPKGEGPAWPHPVILDGKLYLRHDNALFCYDVRSP